MSRACLKKAFRKMYVTICGRFCLIEGGVAGCVNRKKAKYTAKWGVQIAGMIFQTRSNLIRGYLFFSVFQKRHEDIPLSDNIGYRSDPDTDR